MGTARVALRAGGTLVCFLVTPACRAPIEQPVTRPDVVLITVDTLRADRVSPYFTTLDAMLAPLLTMSGHDGPLAAALSTAGHHPRYPTPRIQALGAEGVVFERAYCDVTWTTPSMASTMTATYALTHSLRSNAQRLSAGSVTIAERLASEGYRTAAVIGSYPLDSVYGLDQGFEIYDDTYTVPLFRRSDDPRDTDTGTRSDPITLGVKTDAEVTGSAVDIIRSFDSGGGRERGPFFLWVHYFGPHSVNYVDLDDLQNNRLHVATYSSKVVDSDSAIGELLEFLDARARADDTLVILHSDHGESLWEHGYVGHGRFLYEDNLRIPLIMRWRTGLPRGTRFEPLVGNLDIGPTILEAAGIEVTSLGLDGRSVLHAVRQGGRVRDDLYVETFLPAHEAFAEPADEHATTKVGVQRIGVMSERWKYIVTEPHALFDRPDYEVGEAVRSEFHRRELFDLRADPEELNNVASDVPQVAASCAERLAAYLSSGDSQSRAVAIETPPAHVERLRALGYMD